MLPQKIPAPSSGGPDTFSLDKKLPRLPLPSLKDTAARMVDVAAPFANSDQELNEFKAQIDAEIADPESATRKAHALLEARHRMTDNYVDEWWTDFAYLTARNPLPPIEASSLVFSTLDATSNRQTQRAAILLHYLARFYLTMYNEELNVDGFPPVPFSMRQYRTILMSSRIPGKGKDRQVKHFKTKAERGGAPAAGHFIVACRGSFYKVDALTPSGNLVAIRDLEKAVESVVKDSKNPNHHDKIGILTSAPREEWAEWRSELAKDARNQKNFDLIETALAVFTIEDASHAPTTRKAGVEGAGFGQDGTSRWYDHTSQWSINTNNVVYVSMEHSLQDAAPMLRMADFVDHDMQRHPPGNFMTLPGSIRVSAQRLGWNVAPSVSDACQDLTKRYADLRANFWDITPIRISGVGKSNLKRLKVSPDSFAQLAFQLAYTRVYERIPSTYESVVTLRFQDGRTETGRSVSAATAEFVRQMRMSYRDDASGDAKSRLADILRKAARAHSLQCKTASEGKGIDRHLFAIRIQSMLKGWNVPSYLDCALWTRASCWDLSTSHITLDTAHRPGCGTCFHPVSDESTGIVYEVYADCIDVTVMNCKACGWTRHGDFIVHVRRAVKEMVDVLESSARSKL